MVSENEFDGFGASGSRKVDSREKESIRTSGGGKSSADRHGRHSLKKFNVTPRLEMEEEEQDGGAASDEAYFENATVQLHKRQPIILAYDSEAEDELDSNNVGQI